MKLKKISWIYPYLLISPAVLIILLVVFIPIVRALINSFMFYDLRYPSKTAFIGLKNYLDIFGKDPQFWPSLVRTVLWVIFGVGFQFLFGFLMALLLNRKFRGRGVVRSVSMLPWVMSGVVIGLVWRWLYDGDYGVINDLLLKLRLIGDGIPFLSRIATALPAAIFTVIWQGIPFFALMILAALQGVSHDMYEAADIDGAHSWQKLVHITLPSIKNTVFVTLMLRVIWVTNSVDIIQNMTAGGPAYATQTIGVYVYQKAQVLNLGYASAMAVIMCVLLLFVVIPYLRSSLRNK
ncbi:MAG TPA: sugar ABC transporter permease [Clostridiales bacterium]|nr:sugar ABC transporter permease [Clostridiales bacterium]